MPVLTTMGSLHQPTGNGLSDFWFGSISDGVPSISSIYSPIIFTQSLIFTDAFNYVFAGTGSSNQKLMKLNNYGGIIWQNKLASTSNYDGIAAIALASDTSFYTVGFSQDNSVNTSLATITKYDYDGNVVWQKTLNTTSAFDYTVDLVVDSSNNLFISGSHYTLTSGFPSNIKMFLCKIDASGALIWQRSVVGSSGQTASLGVDSSDNIYWNTGNIYYSFNNMAGSPTYIKSTSSLFYNYSVQSMIINKQNSFMYTVGVNSISNTPKPNIIAKQNLDGTYVTIKQIYNGSPLADRFHLTTDENNNVYLLYSTTTAGIDTWRLHKFDSNLNELFQRTFTSTNILVIRGIKVNGNALCMIGSQLTYVNLYKLPATGTISGTGTYNAGPSNVTYSVGTTTVSAFTAPTIASTSVTVSTDTMTYADGTMTQTTTTVPITLTGLQY